MYDTEVYDMLARDMASGAPFSEKRVLSTILADLKSGPAFTDELAERLNAHKITNAIGAPWTWREVDDLLNQPT